MEKKMKTLTDLFEKYKSIITYVFFGGLTTAVNVTVYYICYDITEIDNIPSTVIAWVAAVAFAFVTNKLFVFESKSWRAKKAVKEAVNFVLCRVGTGIIETALMYIFVDRLEFNGTATKLAVNIIVIVLNYIASKLFIFAAKKSQL